MFDIGFSELLVIGLVALIVIGPERLPRVARTLGHLAGRLQRYVSDVKSDINRSMQQAATSFESSARSELNKTESELNKSVEAVLQDRPLETRPEETQPVETKPQETKAG
jgi:sec-independent protein translocase protein TatB